MFLHMNSVFNLLVISSIFSKMKDFSMSQPVTYTVNVETRKWCQMERLLLQSISNYGLWTRGNSDDLERS